MIEQGVNSYVTLAYANAFHENQRHNADWFSEYVQEDLAAALITSTRFIDYLEFKGAPMAGSQPLKWPRQGAYYNGAYIDSLTVPVQLKYATCQVALDYLRKNLGPGDSANQAAATSIDGVISKLKVGPIEIDYGADGATTTTADSSAVKFLSKEGYQLLKPFLALGAGPNVAPTYRV